jgi:hypothetical protein
MDKSWDYDEGEAERRKGKALQDGYRQRAFLMTKIDGRTSQSATEQLEESLKRLKTDRRKKQGRPAGCRDIFTSPQPNLLPVGDGGDVYLLSQPRSKGGFSPNGSEVMEGPGSRRIGVSMRDDGVLHRR